MKINDMIGLQDRELNRNEEINMDESGKREMYKINVQDGIYPSNLAGDSVTKHDDIHLRGETHSRCYSSETFFAKESRYLCEY
jgi:hypothetical protein